MQIKDLTDKKFFSLIESCADKKRILPPKIKKRSLDISDLLGREEIHINTERIAADLKNKAVLVCH